MPKAKNSFVRQLENLLPLNAPPIHGLEITPDDVNDLTDVTRGIWIGTGGDIKVTTLGGETSTYKNAPSGWLLVGFYTKVHATNTTASNLVAVW